MCKTVRTVRYIHYLDMCHSESKLQQFTFIHYDTDDLDTQKRKKVNIKIGTLLWDIIQHLCGNICVMLQIQFTDKYNQ